MGEITDAGAAAGDAVTAVSRTDTGLMAEDGASCAVFGLATIADATLLSTATKDAFYAAEVKRSSVIIDTKEIWDGVSISHHNGESSGTNMEAGQVLVFGSGN